jgi:dihydrofolate synthase/folylpolyglutamate synthase
MLPSTLPAWLTHLEHLRPDHIELGLTRVATVKQRMKLHPNFPIITVGGTNGKGSTCAMLEAMLHAAGYKVGCYTSPHLLDYNERVRIGKQAVEDAALCAGFTAVEQARQEANVALTYFEFGTLAAMHCFIAQQVEVAILEVGLGGRLDAVNVFDADCALVCSVDIDHVDYLGATREGIAYEKAGIFRAGRIAVFGDTDMPLTIAQEAQRIGAVLWQQGQQFGFRRQQGQWDFYSPQGQRHALPLPALRGSYQLNNASTALAALDALKEKLPVSMEAVRRGLVEVTLAGRFQVLPGRPQVILDVAHNPHAARALAFNLAALPPAKTYAVFAMLRDKDIAGVAAAMKERIDGWLVASIAAPRGATAAHLAEVLAAAQVRGAVRQFDSITAAWQQACNESGEDDRIAVFGSFYTVADVMRERVRTGNGKTTQD